MSSFVYDIKGIPLLTNPTLITNARLCIIALKVEEFLRQMQSMFKAVSEAGDASSQIQSKYEIKVVSAGEEGLFF